MVNTLAGQAVRAVVRAPITLYTVGYGWLLDHRFLMLEHTGRRSGLPRRVVVEVVRRTAENRYVVVSGTGETTDWYRNVRQEPRVRVSVGRSRDVPGTARLLDQAEARTRMEECRAERPGTWRLLRPVLARLLGHREWSDEELFAAVRLVELVLEDSD